MCLQFPFMVYRRWIKAPALLRIWALTPLSLNTINKKSYPRDYVAGQVRIPVLALIFVSGAGAK